MLFLKDFEGTFSKHSFKILKQSGRLQSGKFQNLCQNIYLLDLCGNLIALISEERWCCKRRLVLLTHTSAEHGGIDHLEEKVSLDDCMVEYD